MGHGSRICENWSWLVKPLSNDQIWNSPKIRGLRAFPSRSSYALGSSPLAGALTGLPEVTPLSNLHPPQTAERVPVEGAAVLTGLSVSTLNKMRLTGDGPAYLKLGRPVAYDVVDLNEWMASKRRRSTSEAA